MGSPARPSEDTVPHRNIKTLAELTEVIQAAWSNLEAFLSNLTKDQMANHDDQGWTVSDHIIHLAVWEDSVAVLFQGRPRHEALGVDEAYYLESTFDEINEQIRKKQGMVPADEAVDRLRHVHLALMANLADLTDADIHKPVGEFFRNASRIDERRVVDLIYENTGNHFLEHLEWMRALASGTA
jgi:hypothetical protein